MRERETLRISREEEDGRGERMENGSTFVYRRALRVRQRQDTPAVRWFTLPFSSKTPALSLSERPCLRVLENWTRACVCECYVNSML